MNFPKHQVRSYCLDEATGYIVKFSEYGMYKCKCITKIPCICVNSISTKLKIPFAIIHKETPSICNNDNIGCSDVKCKSLHLKERGNCHFGNYCRDLYCPLLHELIICRHDENNCDNATCKFHHINERGYCSYGSICKYNGNGCPLKHPQKYYISFE